MKIHAISMFALTAAMAFNAQAANVATVQQLGNGAVADITQQGANNNLNVTQTNASKLTTYQQSTGGTANTINATSTDNAETAIYQHSSNGTWNAGGSAGNVANVQLRGALPGYTTNKVLIDQVGYNNQANVDLKSGSLNGHPELSTDLTISQFKGDNTAGNVANVSSTYGWGKWKINQVGGNRTDLAITDGHQNININQNNTANNAAVGNKVTANIRGAMFDANQVGTGNKVTANLKGSIRNFGVRANQVGTNNEIQATQNIATDHHTASYIDQTGSDNLVVANQLNTLDSSYSISQTGIANTANLTQTGSNLVATIAQIGNNNTSTVSQNGTNQVVKITQK